MDKKTILVRYPLKPPAGKRGIRYRRWLESQNDLHLLALDAINDAVFFTTPDGEMTFVNRAAETLLGKSRSELAGTNLLRVFRTVEGDCLADEIMDRANVLSDFDCSLAYIRPARGPLIPVEIHVSSLKFEDTLIRIMATCHDLRQTLEHQRELEIQARTDQLTGCSNRRWFDNEYPRYETWARTVDGWLAILFVDLDRFKEPNDESYVLGDELLKKVTEVIRSVRRPTDPLVRLGGDEFVVPIQGVGPDECREIAQRILTALAETDVLEIAEGLERRHGIRISTQRLRHFRLTASIGMSVIRGCDPRLCDLLRYAQEAKRLAKEAGRNCIYTLPDAAETESARPSVH
ncbi:sensor domain-containing diguanylate cyclase [Candidatus Uhrbacteria bacterium]|nr:sensor domain-containing diguanylate cyclase [Candidatus Uhrbacteria bacterium]